MRQHHCNTGIHAHKLQSHCATSASRTSYTLAELLIVIFIVLLVLGLALPRLVTLPSGPVVKKTLAEMERPFREAALRARATGRTVSLTLDLENDIFRIMDKPSSAPSPWKTPVAGRCADEFTDASSPGDDGGKNKYVYPVSNEVKWSSETASRARQNQLQFTFFPNRETAGPDLVFTCRDRVFCLSLDHLSGEAVILKTGFDNM